MKHQSTINSILKINQIGSYQVSVLFNNGESRIIDFKHLFEEVFKVKAPDPGAKLLADYELFKQIQIIKHTVGWPGVGIHSKNEKGETVFYHYDLDPLVLYQNSEPDEKRNLVIGLMIKQARKEAGLTQQELAERSGTSKHYISRLENNKSDIELLTLKKIVEAGLGKKLKVQIS